MERRLAAILSADIVGYSRLTAVDEDGTLAALTECRTAISDLVHDHAGRIFGTAGDSVIVEFFSAVQAVRCAVAIQRSMNRRNADRPAGRRLEFRIGVNLGDVVVSDDDLLGDGVNIAARLQEVAAPAGICISGSIREQIEGKVGFRIAALGERTLKNIPRPVSVFRVDWRMEDAAESGFLAGPPALPEKPSIAVLPFDNMSGSPDQEYFADGLTEDIITAISRHRWFFVIARNSSFTYKGRAVDVKQAARELGVRYVLEGSVRKAGDRVRVTAQLIDAETGAHVWAERYDQSDADIFEIQDKIAESVAGAIEPEILMGEGRRLGSSGHANPGAYDCCIRGQWHHYQFNRDSFAHAVEWLSRALEIDPTYARTHMALARVYFGDCVFGFSTDFEADRQAVCAHANQAMTLDDRDPYAHYAAFAGMLLSGNLGAAIAAAQRAIDLNPNLALGFLALGWGRVYAGHFQEALDPLHRAIRLSPRDPLGFIFLSRVALAHYHLGNYEEAVHFSERALAIRRMRPVLDIAAPSYAMSGRDAEARSLGEELKRLAGPDEEGYWRAVHPYADPSHRAQLYAGLRKAGLAIGQAKTA